MSEAFSLSAPAKLNLFLYITGQLENGYHQLETLFELLDIGDELQFKPSNEFKFTQSPKADFAEKDNLVVKAARLLQSATGCKKGADIHLNKIIPISAGLGGGSSDAASTLLGLNKLWALNLSSTQLAELGLQLGADVPIFIHGRSAYATGIGEQLRAVKSSEFWYLVLTPQAHISTTNIFNQPNLKRDSTPIFKSLTDSLLTRGATAIKIRALANEAVQNDCLLVVENLYPEIALIRNKLNAYYPMHLSGTGSSLFAEFSTKAEAERMLSQIKSEQLSYRSIFIARGQSVSIAHKELGLSE